MFDTILFDIDGVMLSEEGYFDASAMTVHELLTSEQYLGLTVPNLPRFQPAYSDADVRRLRQGVFADDAVLRAMKSVGVNANWDMVYLQTAHQLLIAIELWVRQEGASTVVSQLAEWTANGWDRETLHHLGAALRAVDVAPDVRFESYIEAFDGCRNKAALFDALDQRVAQLFGDAVKPLSFSRTLWTVCQETFQEWYLGDDYVETTKQPGKTGFLEKEVAIVEAGAFQALLKACRDVDITIGVATGRPAIETRVPLRSQGWLEYFPEERISTASDVLAAEHTLAHQGPLSKPHPFSYLRSYLAAQDAKEVIDYPLPLAPERAHRVLIVGDSIADGLAAKAIGCRFAAVLTGLEGDKVRPQFEQLGADFIWNDVLDLWSVLK